MNALNLGNDDRVKLKGCPFCGSPAMAYHAFPWAEYGWCVDCKHDDECILRHAHGHIFCEETEAGMASVWNRRHEETPSEFERLMEANNV